MPFVGKIKRSQVTATPAGLAYGELAYSFGSHPGETGDTGSNTLFIGDASGNTVAIAGPGMFASYAPLASPAFTGTPTAPTAAPGTNTTQLATTAYVQGQGFVGTATPLSALAPPTTTVSWNSQPLTNLAAPANPNDAATKAYVDAFAAGLDVKASCACGTTANIALINLQVIDGYTTAAGDRVLVKAQSAASQNGIYVASSGSWSRAADFNSAASVTSGSFTFVENGTVLAGTSWVLNTPPPIVVGTTSLTFVQYAAGVVYTASGQGIVLTAGVFSLVGVANQISVSGSGIGVASTYAGQASITTTGTLATGGWDGGTF